MLAQYQETRLRGYLSINYASSKHITSEVKSTIEIAFVLYFENRDNYELLHLDVSDRGCSLIFDYPIKDSVLSIIQSIKISISGYVRKSFPTTIGRQESFWIYSRRDIRKTYIFVSLDASVDYDPKKIKNLP